MNLELSGKKRNMSTFKARCAVSVKRVKLLWFSII
jgi:hypothetical protein